MRYLRLLPVLPAVLFVLVLSVVLTPFSAQAASVASTGSDTVSTDKARCYGTYNGSAPGNVAGKWRCYYDDSRNWVSREGTDITHAFPSGILPPSLGSNCSAIAGTVIEVGPQSAGSTASGYAIPRYAVEISGTWSCSTSGGFPHTSASPPTLRLGPTGSNGINDAAMAANSASFSLISSSGWPAYPADWYPGGSAAVLDPPPPAMTCSRFWNDTSSTEIELTYLVSHGTTPPLPTDPTISYSISYSPAPTAAGTIYEETVGRFRQRVTPDRSTPGMVATITATYTNFMPTTQTCQLLVDERFPDVSDPDADPDGNDGYGCPTGWGLINPTNTLAILKCLFIPPPGLADELLGVDDLEEPTSISESLDDSSVYYPVALVGSIGLDMVDQVTVESIGTCRLNVAWGSSHIGYTGSPTTGLPSVGNDDALAAFGQAQLVNTELCPAGSYWVAAVNLVRTVSFIAAATAGLWMSVRFVKELGAYKSGGI